MRPTASGGVLCPEVLESVFLLLKKPAAALNEAYGCLSYHDRGFYAVMRLLCSKFCGVDPVLDEKISELVVDVLLSHLLPHLASSCP